MNASNFKHESVLLDEAVALLVNDINGFYLDGTFGRGGHSRKILANLSNHGRLLVTDKDPQAIRLAEQMASEDNRLTVAQSTFANLDSLLASFSSSQNTPDKLHGILLDLGVSSPQLDDPERGFSFLRDGPLDMRMDPTSGESAQQWLAGANAEEIADVLYHYGEEKFSRRMARAIVEARAVKSITRTGQLAEILSAANSRWEKGKHPATRAFQGIRIHINRELKDLEEGLETALNSLHVGGRLVVISFHSLEDRIVKRFMRNQAKGNQQFPQGLPIPDIQLNKRLVLIGKARKPSDHEITQNPRARSAVMRVAEKIA